MVHVIRRYALHCIAAVVVALPVVHLDVDRIHLVATSRAAADHVAPEGFGATTRGGTGQPEYHVTSLDDSGYGTLRDAVAHGYRRVVFDVGGTIALRSPVVVSGPFITIDGTTAPAPGITVTNHGMAIRGSAGAHDVILRGLRLRGAGTRETNVDSSNDCLGIGRGAYNVLVDHVSISGCLDGAIDIVGDVTNEGTPETRNITVQWSLLADTRKSMLIKYGTTRISLHHNVFVRSLVRLPAVSREDHPVDDDVTVDMRNNVIWDWAGGTGTIFIYGTRANVINNVYGNPTAALSDQKQGLIVCKGDGAETPESLASCAKGTPEARSFVHTSGNLSVDGVAVNRVGNVNVAYAAAPVTTSSACAGAHAAASGAGALPRDQKDAAYVALVRLPTCETAPVTAPLPSPTPVKLADLVMPYVSAPSTIVRGSSFGLNFTVKNQGTATAPASRLKIYVSKDGALASGDVNIRARDIAIHGPGAVSKHGLSDAIPFSIAPGSYYLLFVLDANRDVKESNEGNNIVRVPIRLR
jgi:hypothetical protein